MLTQEQAYDSTIAYLTFPEEYEKYCSISLLLIKTRGLLTKAFPPVTLKELRQWKKENLIENSNREQSS